MNHQTKNVCSNVVVYHYVVICRAVNNEDNRKHGRNKSGTS